MLLRVENLRKSFGGVLATDDVSMELEAGQTHAIIGPNGAGKTTLVMQLTGELRPDDGRVFFDDRDVTDQPVYRRSLLGMARSFQITSIIDDLNVRQNVMLAVQSRAGHSYRFWRSVDRDPALTAPAEEMLALVGLEDKAHSPASALSHGEHRQLEVAIAMATRPRLLLLDEPMAGIGGEESTRMMALFQSIKGGPGILFIEHDMDVVFALADRISVLVNGAIIASDTPEAIRNNAQVRAAYLGETD